MSQRFLGTLPFALLTFALLIPSAGAAQLASAGEVVQTQAPEFSQLLNSFSVTRAEMYDRLVETTTSAAFSNEALGQLESILSEHEEMMQMGHMHSMGPSQEMEGMGMGGGALAEFESEVLAELLVTLQEEHSIEDARTAFEDSDALPERLARVMDRGRQFEARIYDIYLDGGISDKIAAVDAAVDAYLSEPEIAVPDQPKVTSLIFGHPYESAFTLAFPRISGTIWASQWLRIAALEPLLGRDTRTDMMSGLQTTMNRFERKVLGESPRYPIEMPMVPAIAPTFLLVHPRASAVIDNLNMLETVIADVLVHPGVPDRDQAINAAVTEFTLDGSNISARDDWIYSALRGGIFNQGGPAIGVLERSERNRTRREMEMGGHVVMPGMN